MSVQITQEHVIQSIPSYLRQFVVKQYYDAYTPQDHAVWRYVMHRNLDFLRDLAHPAYIDGLQKTGIGTEYIPHIDEMNECLARIGWRAVVVDGFVPPAAFMEFQAHKILVISADIRNIKNVIYTPAPDIIHEAAGHAPIIADDTYSDFLQRVGEYGSKSVFSKLDYDIYEAIRYLSIIKEYPETTPQELEKAEKDLAEKMQANTNPSESALLSRLHWWTVEYGLVGSVDDFKIYGAGILSSVGESKACLNPSVKKIRLTTDAALFDYDITTMQPQLFVADDFGHLLDVIEEFADGMCFRKGGIASVKRVIESENVGTVVYSSGLQVSGVLSEVLPDTHGREAFIRTAGPTALAFADQQLDGHDTTYHADGFSSPVGRVSGLSKALEDCTESDLSYAGIEVGTFCTLAFESGFRVSGTLEHGVRKNGKTILLRFRNCTVHGPGGQTLFNPEWGMYDMAVGERIVSAYSGTADKENYNVYPPKSSKTAIKVTYSESETYLFGLYQAVRDMRNSGSYNAGTIHKINTELETSYQKNWLLRLELYELLKKHQPDSDLFAKVSASLASLRSVSEEYEDLIVSGLHYLDNV